MKGKQCGLLLALLIMLGLSLSVSLDSSALKYGITNFNIGNTITWFDKLVDSNNIEQYVMYDKQNVSPFIIAPDDVSVEFPHTWLFSGVYSSESNTCELPSGFNNSYYYSDGVYSYDYPNGGTIYRFNRPPNSVDSFDGYNLYSSDSPFDLEDSSHVSLIPDNNFGISDDSYCVIMNHPYSSHDPGSDGPLPDWNWSSLINIPLVNNRFEYEKSKPYFYNYNKISMIDKVTQNGVVSVRDGLKMSEFLGNKVPSFSDLAFGFSLFDDPTTILSFDDSISETVYNFNLHGSIVFDDDYQVSGGIRMTLNNFNHPGFDSSLTESIQINGHTVYNISSSSNVTTNQGWYSDIACSFTDYHVSNGDPENRIDFVCKYDPTRDGGYSPEIDFEMIDVSVGFHGCAAGDWINCGNFLETTGDYTFKDFYIVTNNDYTDAGWDATVGATGGNVESSPGASDESGLIPDWDESLKNMFSFFFVNPFAPLFDMFDNSQCASIPTLAGMLHTDNTQVCPFFDNNTRNIVTPVLAIFSVMLVFGFAVRWLGSGSGNYMDDSEQSKFNSGGIK